ncbi:MAG: response regulator [Lachnospiraceae bacterium]|nr:response regulator [Lachnospiraceae bacterium]
MTNDSAKASEHRLIIIRREQSFVTDSLVSALEEQGIRCICVDTEIREIEAHKDEADLILLYINDDVTDMTKVLVFLKDVCADDSKSLYLAGHPGQIEEVYRLIPTGLVKEVFERPFNIKKMVGDLSYEAEKAALKKGTKKILIVDDDVTFLKLIKKWLMDSYQVTVVKSGVQAIKYLTGHKPDLVLMDYDMPITNGSQVLEMMRSEPEYAGVPVIFLTGKADKATVMQVMSLKPQGYLLKNMNRTDLVSAIDNYFETEKWQNAALFS